MIDAALLEAFGQPPDAEVREVPGGLINATWEVGGGPDLVLQRLHPIFGAEVNEDIAAVTAHLARRGIPTPELVPATGGALWVESGGQIFRALTYARGVTVHRIASPEQAFAAGQTAGRFHRGVDDLEHDYRFTRAGVHDTAAHLARLETHERETGNPAEAVALARDVLAAAGELPELPQTRRRHSHGDLKISNIRFASDDPWTPGCLIDLDTLGLQTAAYELGDGLRSWCNPRGEDTDAPDVDLEILEHALRGHAAGSEGLLDPVEVDSLAAGLATVTLELAARFCIDAFEDRYFGWDPRRFASRREHNLLRARGQLALARSALERLDDARALARKAFGL